MSKINGVEHAEWIRGPPPTGSLWERFALAIYNPEEKSFLGRTAKRWGITLSFYLVFYIVLAAMFAMCMGGLFLTLDNDKPSYVLDESLIGSSPGVTLRPIPDLHYDVTNTEDYVTYIHQLQAFLSPYREHVTGSCSAEDKFGFPESPCFYIKVNKIIDWVPECYDGISSPLPDDMEADLKAHIMGLSPDKRSQVWVSCWEEHDNTTHIEYPWGRGLALSSFPYTNQKGYVNPIVAVKVTPKVGSFSTLRCRAWAKNIIYNKSIKEAAGYVPITIHLTTGTTEVTDTKETIGTTETTGTTGTIGNYTKLTVE